MEKADGPRFVGKFDQDQQFTVVDTKLGIMATKDGLVSCGGDVNSLTTPYKLGLTSMVKNKVLQAYDKDDKLHRHWEDGAAWITADGTSEYWFNGERHRPKGPAVTRADGTSEYWIDGKHLHSKNLGPAATKADGTDKYHPAGAVSTV